MSTQIDALEERIAHLIRMVDDMSDVIARQDTDITRLQSQVTRLILREAERQNEQPGGVVLGDERPPHY
ncbi:SlyX family protein [Marinovum sp. 2_MG-2023]|uniref:SlyX family protein n=1 Tax=Roseobacteraceae TaxID=2854170 RepID=UPI001FD623C0|nr:MULTISPECIES: SlyX family protein [Roseobacteraceae]MCJ7871141.1 SlyX family protein [Phaeobacter sp. J2-8]MDO6729632.1 SlyX family protein [Marinovum sp. 2_MG-2023]MDO6779446.1 SlyX family protein [Marinovum sp. 1_MG-2023]